ncbi:One of two inversely orientated ORFs in a partial ISC1043 [Saccharolobus solfataricus P2]|uniref:One of two inversely orientated ORFs in a partial ISC1043 n=2 Tax=Saccharolobus solfataricus TaxID=2287 RepID=Q97YF4_SACS2|nr:One of two inversely orientated ORFs in a partial ISC1043 [Saccharolobus solfataricus P2]SAI85038.1 ORF in ISC1043 [Saccharolobus solfataricus]
MYYEHVSILEKFLDYDLVVYPLPKAINFLKALVNKKLTQKDFDNFKESIEDLIKLYKESRLSKIENSEESEEERLARLRRFGRELRQDLEEAKFVKIKKEQGRKSKLTPQEKAYILIIREYLGTLRGEA